MTPSLRCPECRAAARGPMIHGTALVLCPVCWRVLDPAAPPPPTPLPEPAPPPPRPAPVPPLPPLPPLPRFPRPTPADELAALGYVPRSYLGPLFPRGVQLFLLAFAAIPATALVLLLYWYVYPDFVGYDDPTGHYAASFPAPPAWVRGAAGAADGVAWRETGFGSEAYRVRATRLDRSARVPPGEIALALTNRAYPTALLIRPRSGVPDVDGAAEFERREADTRYRVVGRVVVVGGYAYELSVAGRNVSLGDRRVRHFFDSFRAYRR